MSCRERDGSIERLAETAGRPAARNRFPSSPFSKGLNSSTPASHVPRASTLDRTQAIEARVERFAPGFRDRILARRAMSRRVYSAAWQFVHAPAIEPARK